MTVPIDEGGLDFVRPLLKFAGAGAGQTLLDDGNISQVLDVGPSARRARTLPLGAGLVQLNLNTTSPGAAENDVTLAPYGTLAGVREDGFPAEMDELELEIWLLSVSLLISGTTSNWSEAALAVAWADLPTATEESAATGTTPPYTVPLAYWDGTLLATTMSNSPVWAQELTGGIRRHIGLRLPPPPVNPTLNFWSEHSGGGAVANCQILAAIVPVAYGQDVAF